MPFCLETVHASSLSPFVKIVLTGEAAPNFCLVRNAFVYTAASLFLRPSFNSLPTDLECLRLYFVCIFPLFLVAAHACFGETKQNIFAVNGAIHHVAPSKFLIIDLVLIMQLSANMALVCLKGLFHFDPFVFKSYW